jgi:hypothetical protein
MKDCLMSGDFYRSPLCDKLGYSVDCVPHGNGYPEATFDLLPAEKKLIIYQANNQDPAHKQTIEDRVKAAERYHEQSGINDSKLVGKRFQVLFSHDTAGCKTPYFGVSTMEKKIMFYNVNRWDEHYWPIMRSMFQQADLIYSTCMHLL